MSLPAPTVGRNQNAFPYNNMTLKEMEELDAPLIALTTRCNGDLRKLLYAFFSFLHRRTDFYMVPSDEDDEQPGAAAKMGFRAGDAEKVLLAAFRQFPLRKLPPQSQIKAATKAKQQAAAAPQAAASSKTTGSSASTATTELVPAPTSQPGETPKTETVAADESATATTSTVTKEHEQKKGSETDEAVRYTEEGLQIPVGNGGTTPRYKWTQTIDETTVLIGVGNHKAKDLDVVMTSGSIAVRSKLADHRVFVDGELSEKIVPSESTWTLEGGVLIMVLYKHVKTFWETVIKGDDKIDTSLVDSRRHIDEYDESTQAQIRKIIYDQSRMQQGLPTSDEESKTGFKIPPVPPDLDILDTANPTAVPSHLPPGVEYIDQKKLDEIKKSAT